MKRKRFVRLVMASYIDRNHANMLADDVKRRGIPYAVAHQKISHALNIFRIHVFGTQMIIQKRIKSNRNPLLDVPNSEVKT